MKKCILLCLTLVFSLQAGQEPFNPRYENVRIIPMDVSVQCWTFNQFTFEQALAKINDLGVKYVEAYPGQRLSEERPESETFGHHMTAEQRSWVKDLLKQYDLTLVSYGVVHFDNTREAAETVFQFARDMGIYTLVIEPEYDDFTLIESLVKDYNIRVGVHNHPEPSKYWNPYTVYNTIKDLDPRIGVCADTGHWLRSGVNPVEALRFLTGRITNVHLKDLNKAGRKTAHDVPFGSGAAHIYDVLAELTLQDYHGFLAVEHENKAERLNPSPSIEKGLDYIKNITHLDGYRSLLPFNRRNLRYSKHGWNHYGPGYFILDEENGVLESHKGMGLLWYSAEPLSDFVLELDFKSESMNTNSGIFLRIPDVVVNNDYITNSFEIQIYDRGMGTHKTGAVYDAEAPIRDAMKPDGQWNHYKITCKGDRYKVELNGALVIDWIVEPRGKITSFSENGYFGLQNHDDHAVVRFKNIYLKKL
ncbi:MAG: family 16 glycoside hydrolase [candidate division KSB1 bacterium]|nr:family 16 glycoside hydrolase [candidate division KSB1 bacterium]